MELGCKSRFHSEYLRSGGRLILVIGAYPFNSIYEDKGLNDSSLNLHETRRRRGVFERGRPGSEAPLDKTIE